MFSMMYGMTQGNIQQNLLYKYGYGGDFGTTPQPIKYTTEFLPKGNYEANRLPATFWSQVAKYYFF